jgi:outer membrane protein
MIDRLGADWSASVRGKPRRPLRASGLKASAAIALLAGLPAAARAETLADALTLAYQSNPTLQQARAQLRALDESDPQARAGWRPTVTVTASDDYERVFQHPVISVNQAGAALNLSQPIYTGGRTARAVDAADATIAAGREALRASEATVLQSVVQAYEDVLRDQALLAISEKDLAALRSVNDEITAKFVVGTTTRTDVLQIQAQVATSEATIAQARAQLQISRANYVTAVGQNPGQLVPPPPLPQLPADPDAAFAAATADNPALRQATLNEVASRARVAQARAGWLPQLSAGVQLGYTGNNTPASTVDYSKALTAQVTLTVPLYNGDMTGSLVRQAVEQNNSDLIGIEGARRQAVQAVSHAWNQLIAAQQSARSQRAAQAAAELAFIGMREEYRLALRSTLDVLTAEEAVRQAEAAVATADHDAYMAGVNLLAAVGRLEARYLVSGVGIYDPKTNFNRIRHKGELPYEPLIAGLDSALAPQVGRAKQIPPLVAPHGVALLPPGPQPNVDAPLITASPVQALKP